MEQDFHAQRASEFLREVGMIYFVHPKNMYILGTMGKSNSYFLRADWLFFCCFSRIDRALLQSCGLLGCHDEANAASKHSSLHGCCYSAPKLVHSYRVFIRVWDNFWNFYLRVSLN